MWRGSSRSISGTGQRLQRLRQQRVVGVGERRRGDAPRPRPSRSPCTSTRSRISSATAMAGCVSLSWIATLSARRRASPCWLQVPAHEVLQRGGGEEILLPQPQFLAGRRGVARDRAPWRSTPARTRSASAPTWSPWLKASSRSGSARARRPQPQRVHMPRRASRPPACRRRPPRPSPPAARHGATVPSAPSIASTVPPKPMS